MKTAVIKNAMWMNKVIEGEYEVQKPWFPVESGPRDGKMNIFIHGGAKQIWVNEEDITYSNEPIKPIKKMTDEEILEKIEKRFDVMGKMTNGVIAGVIRSLIISGAPGIGKTYNLEKRLNTAAEAGRINFEMVKGKISPIGLYMKLWEMRDQQSVLVLDDVDVFGNEDTLNVLKAALDTGEKRTISWSTASSWLEEKDIPNSFEYEGTCVFITNTDIDKELARGSKNAPHLDALVSRSIYLDLAVHSNRDIMIWVEKVISSTDMLSNKGLDNMQQANLVQWMKENVDRLRNVSLRTALYIADFIITDPENWHSISEVTMLRPH
ncbi:hypothetical protein [Vibrio sp. ER1A]|uniref:hypothetical protein n=1 Tax=Vibrio sp. ER1A TaxID=1517681 RepID=UPI0004DD8C6D|nr:hypothetical protein [Vibrio sp. ER1A]KFA99389.1 hypothetical protein HW45_04130 [Vibrio sp. ER1A]